MQAVLYFNRAFINNLIVLFALTVFYCIIYLIIFAVSYLISRRTDKVKTTLIKALKSFIQERATLILLYFYILLLMLFLMCAALFLSLLQ